MSLRIGFVFPSSEYLHDPFRGDPHTHFQILTVLEDYFGNDVDVLLVDLRGIKKHFATYHIPECKESIDLLKKVGIETRIYMIIGLPGEPGDIVDQTWSFIQETVPDSVYLSLFTIRPGTEVYNNPQKYGIKDIKKNCGNTMHMHGRYKKRSPRLPLNMRSNCRGLRSIVPR
ncbi:hypothetical protein N9L33_01860 [Nitrospinae bacterium]|nr:hypothetical protein [Nitrospinota bacterium]